MTLRRTKHFKAQVKTKTTYSWGKEYYVIQKFWFSITHLLDFPTVVIWTNIQKLNSTQHKMFPSKQLQVGAIVHQWKIMLLQILLHNLMQDNPRLHHLEQPEDFNSPLSRDFKENTLLLIIISYQNKHNLELIYRAFSESPTKTQIQRDNLNLKR